MTAAAAVASAGDLRVARRHGARQSVRLPGAPARGLKRVTVKSGRGGGIAGDGLGLAARRERHDVLLIVRRDDRHHPRHGPSVRLRDLGDQVLRRGRARGGASIAPGSSATARRTGCPLRAPRWPPARHRTLVMAARCHALPDFPHHPDPHDRAHVRAKPVGDEEPEARSGALGRLPQAGRRSYMSCTSGPWKRATRSVGGSFSV